MSWNDVYWQNKNTRAERAEKHHKKMIEQYKVEIINSVNRSEIWDDNKISITNPILMSGESNISVVNLDTVSALFQLASKKTVVLNFASYKHPGGGFLKGSSAQEESLCMESDLYEILSHPNLAAYYDYNKDHLNKALYTNRAIYTPDVVFERNNHITVADVITCAAPNRYAYINYANGTDEELNLAMLSSRIRFVCDIVKRHAVNNVILGAFGCGVFAQDPKTVASFFKGDMEKTMIKTIYAVIDKGGHSKEGAYKIFKDVFRTM